MKKRTIDDRPTVTVSGNVDDYPTKNDFLKEKCVPAALEAKAAGKALVIESRYDRGGKI